MVDFAQYLPKKNGVVAHVCPKCGKKYYPAPMVCSECGTRRDPAGVAYEPWPTEDLEGPCTLLTWTRLSALPIGFDARYMVFGIVEFLGGLRASGVIHHDKPQIGMTFYARAAVVRTNRGVAEYGLVFEEAADAVSARTA